MKTGKFLFILLLVFTISSSARGQLEFSLSPSFSMLSGGTEYSLRASGIFVDSSFTEVKQTIASLLEFPLGSKFGGFNFKLNPKFDRTRWQVNLSVHTSLTNPSAKMIDTDWDEALPYYTETKFSFTESDAELSMLNFNLELTYRVFKIKKTAVSFLVGVHYQKITQNIIGFDGWQKRLDANKVWSAPIFFSSDEPALDYEIKFTQPQVGILTAIEFSPQFITSAKAAFAPVFYSDRDDHLLRHKLSTSSGDGNGFLGSLNATYHFKNNPDIKRYFIALNIDYFWANPQGKQKQVWYDDELRYNREEDIYEVAVPKGTVIGGIPHFIKSSQTMLSLQIGISF